VNGYKNTGWFRIILTLVWNLSSEVTREMVRTLSLNERRQGFGLDVDSLVCYNTNCMGVYQSGTVEICRSVSVWHSGDLWECIRLAQWRLWGNVSVWHSGHCVGVYQSGTVDIVWECISLAQWTLCGSVSVWHSWHCVGVYHSADTAGFQQ
jgi:hypothetical protein